MRRVWFVIASIVVASSVVTACGIGNDDTPRDIPEVDQLPLGVGGDSNAGATTGTARVYLLAPEVDGQTSTLEAVARDVDETPSQVLAALLAGPNAGELDLQYRTALPVDLRVLSATSRGGVLVIDVSRELLQLSGEVLVSAVAQLVFTGSEVPGVQSVKILVEGADQQWPAGNGEVQSTPLTVYDYPGLVPSAQPAYPAIPSPSQP